MVHRLRSSGVTWSRATAAALVVIAAVATPTGGVGAQSLTDALSVAYSSNPTLEAARARLRAQDEAVPQAIANWLPTVTADVSAGLARSDSKAADRVDTEPRSGQLALTQTLFQGGRNFAQLSQAENLVQAERARLWSDEQGVLLDAATAFLDVVRDQAVVNLRINNVQVLQRQLEATEDRFAVGENTRTDVAQAQSRVANAEAQRTAAEGDLTQSRAAYREVIGELPGELDFPPPPGGLPPELQEAIDQAAQENPDVIQAQWTQEAADDGVDDAIGVLLPSLSVEGSIAHNQDNTIDDQLTNSASIVGRLTIPIFQGGAEHSAVREAKQLRAQRQLEVDAARRTAVENATSAFESLRTAEAQIRSFEAEVRATQIALEGVQQEQAVGARTVLDVLDAEQEALDAQVNLVVAQRDRIVSGYQLLSAIGRLTARDLELPVDYHDPEVYSRRSRWGLIGTGIE